MRWLKHLSLAHADGAIAFILEKHGAEGYGVWWLILEDIAAPMEPGKMFPGSTHSVVKWAQICHCSVRVWRSIASSLAENSLIDFESTDNRITITVGNILKYKDEYSKRSVQTPEQDREQIQKQIESRKNLRSSVDDPVLIPTDSLVKKEKPPDRIGIWFLSDFWPLYPRKVAKQSALRAARKALVGVTPAVVMSGLRAQLPKFQALIVAGTPDRVPHAATWLNGKRWEDEIENISISVTGGTATVVPFRESATEKAIRIGKERIAATGRL